MFKSKFILAVILCAAAGPAGAQSFELQVQQISQMAALKIQQIQEDYEPPMISSPLAGRAPWYRIMGTGPWFFLSLPGRPVYSATTARRSPSGAAFTVHRFETRDSSTNFALGARTLPPDVDTSNPREYLQKELDEAATILEGGKWTKVTWTKQNDIPAVDSVGVIRGRAARMYMILSGKVSYVLTYVGPAGSAESDIVNEFIQSLTVQVYAPRPSRN